MTINKELKENIFLFVFFFLLTLLIFHKSLSFVFIIDDNALLLYAKMHSLSSYGIYWLHPATVIESFLIFKIFGLSPIWGFNALAANFFGIFLRSTAAFTSYLFVFRLSGSRKLGFLAGFFMVISFVGIQSTTWLSAQNGLLDLILTIYTIYRYIVFSSSEKRKDFIVFLITFFITLFMDPLRNFVILAFIGFLFFLEKIEKRKINIKKEEFFKFSLVFVLTGIFLGIWYLFFKNLIHNAHHFHFEPFRYFFGSVSSQILDFKFRPFEFDLNIYKRLSNVYLFVDFAMVTLASLSFTLFVKSKKKVYKLLSIFFFWTYLFYIPSWLSYPRDYVPAAHRYSEVSGFGLVAICSILNYFIFKKNKYLGIILFLLLGFINISTTNSYLNQENFYRNKYVITRFWNNLNNQVPKNEIHPLIYIAGEYSLAKYGIAWSNSWPIRSMRGSEFNDNKFSPMISQDLNKLVNQVCQNDSRISHFYAYKVNNDGSIEDIKTASILQIKNGVNKNNCKALIKKYGSRFSFW